MKYIQQNGNNFSDVLLNINIDGLGYQEGMSAFSPFNLPDGIRGHFDSILRETPGIVEGAPWYQGDHSIFIQKGCPAVAVSSNWFVENMTTQDVTHTPKDNLSIVDSGKVLQAAMAIHLLIGRLNN